MYCQVVSERKIRFTSNHCPKELLERIEHTVVEMGFHVQKRNGKVRFHLLYFLIKSAESVYPPILCNRINISSSYF